MKATKYEVKIVVEVLSVDSAHGLIAEVKAAIGEGIVDGELRHDDGDFVKWSTIETPVKF
jgi:hypothetical protein